MVPMVTATSLFIFSSYSALQSALAVKVTTKCLPVGYIIPEHISWQSTDQEKQRANWAISHLQPQRQLRISTVWCWTVGRVTNEDRSWVKYPQVRSLSLWPWDMMSSIHPELIQVETLVLPMLCFHSLHSIPHSIHFIPFHCIPLYSFTFHSTLFQFIPFQCIDYLFQVRL